MKTLDHGWLNASSGSRASALREREPGWRPHRHARWPAPWPALVAALLAAAVLVAYVQVLRASVEQSESRLRAVAAHADRAWRCGMLRFAMERAGCRAQLDAERSTLAAASL